ncbi:MAG: MFS transporter [Myxococcota bacterium]|nr:MFS transporter [Myxococcota bacterium]
MVPRLRVLRSILGDRELRRVAGAFGAYSAADAGTWVAILVYAYQRGGVVEAGLVGFVQLLPAAIAAPASALAGDRFRRDAVLAAGHAAQAVSMAGVVLAMACAPHRFWVYGAGALVCIALTFTKPALGALLPAVTRTPEDLVAANASIGVLENLGALLGPLGAAGLLLWAGPGAVFAAGVFLTGAACLLVATLGLDPHLTAPPAADERGSLPSRIGAGVAFVRRELDVLLLASCVASPSVLLGALEVLLVAVATELLGRGEHVTGYLTASLGIGGLAGASLGVLLIGRRRLAAALCLGGLLMSAPILAVPATVQLPIALALLFLSGVGEAFAQVVGITLMQRAAPDRFRARVFGVLEGLHVGFLALGTLLVSAVSAWLGAAGALVVFALLVPAIMTASLRRLLAIDEAAAGPPSRILASLQSDPIFAPLPAPAIERLAARARLFEAPEGHTVMREGDVGYRYYQVLFGDLEVSIGGRPVRRLGPGDSFGEIALLRAVPRTATVSARSATTLIALDRDTFLETVTGYPQSRARADQTARRHLDA